MILTRTGRFIVAGVAFSCLFFSDSAADDLNTSTQLKAIYECTAIQEELPRLACFDAAVAEFKSASASGDIVTVSKSEIQEAKKESFGFNLPSLSGLGKVFKSGKDKNPSEDDISKRVELTIDRTKKYDRSRTRFYFTNGQIWEQISTERVFVPKVKDGVPNTAIIKKAAFGSFLLRVNGKSTPIRVKRVQ